MSQPTDDASVLRLISAQITNLFVTDKDGLRFVGFVFRGQWDEERGYWHLEA